MERSEEQFHTDCVKLCKKQGTGDELHVHRSLRSTTYQPIMYEDMYGEHYPQSEQQVEWMIVPFWEETWRFEKHLKRMRLYYDTVGEIGILVFRARMFLRRLRYNNKIGRFHYRTKWRIKRWCRRHI